jgi:hypothetical protein
MRDVLMVDRSSILLFSLDSRSLLMSANKAGPFMSNSFGGSETRARSWLCIRGLAGRSVWYSWFVLNLAINHRRIGISVRTVRRVIIL